MTRVSFAVVVGFVIPVVAGCANTNDDAEQSQSADIGAAPRPQDGLSVEVLRAPGADGADRWRAEARRAGVVLLTTRTQRTHAAVEGDLQRLGVALHEESLVRVKQQGVVEPRWYFSIDDPNDQFERALGTSVFYESPAGALMAYEALREAWPPIAGSVAGAETGSSSRGS